MRGIPSSLDGGVFDCVEKIADIEGSIFGEKGAWIAIADSEGLI